MMRVHIIILRDRRIIILKIIVLALYDDDDFHLICISPYKKHVLLTGAGGTESFVCEYFE